MTAALALLLKRDALSVKNALRSQTPWEWVRNGAFVAVGLWMLAGIHYGFHRLLIYLDTVEIIGPLLIWKLTAMALMTTFSMVVLSSLIISLTTLFYSFDLPFLMNSPVPARAVFMEKSLESAFFSSWMIGLVLVPFVVALGQVKGVSPGFYVAFTGLMLPFLLTAASLGMAFTLALMYLFPSSRTRDALWLLSSASMAMVYVLLRASEPEKLARPDALRVIADYLGFLQAPTAPYLPSWWMTKALSSYAGAGGPSASFWGQAALLTATAAGVYAGLVWLSGRLYAVGYSGAQEGRRSRRRQGVEKGWESRLASRLGVSPELPGLVWKDRLMFFRDVKHWSQMVLIVALMCVYLFSIQRLPADTPDLKNLLAFLNLGIAGFVISSLGLRFTFPAVSLEGRSFWVVRSAPLSIETLMLEKFLYTLAPMMSLSVGLILASNRLLEADGFVSALSVGTIAAMTWTLCGMGVGFGAIFPKFNIPNIHQIESSAGGFVYMAAALAYVGFTLALEAWPMQMHFQTRFGRADAWDWTWVGVCAGGFALVNLLAFSLPWWLGRGNLEAYEGQ